MSTKVVPLGLEQISSATRSTVSVKECQCTRKARYGNAEKYGLRHYTTEGGRGRADGLGEEGIEQEIVEIGRGLEGIGNISEKDTMMDHA